MREVMQLFVLTIVLLSSAIAGAAQPYPSKPLRFIVPFAPGGGNDIIARVIGQKLSERWGTQVVVDNRPGAGGNVAAEITAKAAPDGHTVFQFNIANVIAVGLYKKLSYDPVRDFSPVTQLASSPFLLVINPAVKAATTQEFMVLAKTQPGKLNYGSSGNGGSTHLAMELMKSMANINLVHVPYGGAGPALPDLISGQVQALFTTPLTAVPHVKSGRLRSLGVSSAKRIAMLPEMPTIAESGVPGYESSAWYGVVVPARTPRDIVMHINTELVRILRDKEMIERMSSQGVDLVGNSPEAFGQFIKSEIAKWVKIVKASGAIVD